MGNFDLERSLFDWETGALRLMNDKDFARMTRVSSGQEAT